MDERESIRMKLWVDAYTAAIKAGRLVETADMYARNAIANFDKQFPVEQKQDPVEVDPNSCISTH